MTAARMPSADPAGSSSDDADLASLGDALLASAYGRVDVTLPHDGRRVQIQAYVRHETLSSGELPANFGAVPNKVPYELDGVATYPELLLVGLLERAGWGAAWRKTWNGDAWWRAVREPVTVPETVISVLDQVSVNVGHSGQWEIVGWRDRSLRLLTSRAAGRQPVSAYQAEWLSVALRMGMPIGCFAVVEHRVRAEPRRRRLEHVTPQ